MGNVVPEHCVKPRVSAALLSLQFLLCPLSAVAEVLSDGKGWPDLEAAVYAWYSDVL
jgi:hypothetical protein